MDAFHRVMTLERGLISSMVLLASGGVLLLLAVNNWRITGFGDLDYTRTMRLVVPGVMLTALGVQTLLASFLVTMLRSRRV
jgi:hypothetical protein